MSMSERKTDHIQMVAGEGANIRCFHCGGTIAIRPSLPLSKINDLLLFAESLHGECKQQPEDGT